MSAVLIVGAGPVGLTLACELRRYGLDVRIIDKNDGPSITSKALAIWSRTLEVFHDMGLADEFLAAGNPIHSLSLYVDSENKTQVPIDRAESPFSNPIILPQSQTEAILIRRLQSLGVLVERNLEFVSLEQQASSLEVCLRRVVESDGDEEDEEYTEPQADIHEEFAWVVGCDGAHSGVRRALGLAFEGSAEPGDWILADVDVQGSLPSDEVSVFLSSAGPLLFFPLGDGAFRVVAAIDAEPEEEEDQDAENEEENSEPEEAEKETEKAEIGFEDIKRLVAERGPEGLTLSSSSWISSFQIQERLVEQYRLGRVFLAGDAAHVHSPAGGQGMNTGIQDAYNLGWKLAAVQRGTGIAHLLLESYGLERKPVAEEVLRFSGTLIRVAALRNPLLQKLRNTIVPKLLSLSFMQKKLQNTLSELKISYRSSLLSMQSEDLKGAKLLPGDRLPPLPLTAPDGGESNTFDVTKGAPHVLFLYGKPERFEDLREAASRAFKDQISVQLIVSKPEDANGTGGCFVDSSASFRDAVGLAPPFALAVRPDGHLSYLGRGYHRARILAHLGSYLQFQEEV